MWPNLEAALKFKAEQPFEEPIFDDHTNDEDDLVVYLRLTTDLPFDAFGAQKTTDHNSIFWILMGVAKDIAERIEGAAHIGHCLQRPAPGNPDGIENYDEIYVRLTVPWEWDNETESFVPNAEFMAEVRQIAVEERRSTSLLLDSVPLIRTLQAEHRRGVTQ
ncbi:hypothetical protein R4P47_06905 [Rhodococcus sp. IEGM 1370]|uniref:hypothetical protein n=1 Tax=Rhodococcus sp. IEGM 1370 TaxID=3082222 RepID=UPI0029530543|nr:hypothetical protein [Rhodococcus sp. IEGM 1370]MDV8076283.1 hypothetical protein [Rhodococcus sp. IEGM 1370]